MHFEGAPNLRPLYEKHLEFKRSKFKLLKIDVLC